MSPLSLHEPTALSDAVALLDRYGPEARVIAGGTAVVLMLQNRLIAPEHLVSLGRVPALSSVLHEAGVGLRIGALTTLRAAETAPLIRQHSTVLAHTYGTVANVRIRNAATVGGNLTEADYASDPPAVLVALRARVKAVSPRGEREVPLTNLFTDFYETSLAPDEIVTEIIVPDHPAGTRAAYLKFTTRSTEDRPCLGVAALVELDASDVCQDLRVVVGAVAATPREVPAAEGLARGHTLTDELIDELAERYAAEIEPLSDLRGSAWYRTEMIRVFVRRAIKAAISSSGQREGSR
jgi:carbon-monoxide dehydrogenase medium subunit